MGPPQTPAGTPQMPMCPPQTPAGTPQMEWPMGLPQSRVQMAAGSKEPQDDAMMGLIREAMALRVKFRLKDENQKDRAKKILLLTMLCVNRHNRGGNYPNPTTVLNLLLTHDI